MPTLSLTRSETDSLITLFFRLKGLGEKHPAARQEVMAALRALKGVHSSAIEDKSIDRIFLQLLLHGAGIPDKTAISPAYHKASLELRGLNSLLLWLEQQAPAGAPLSISLLLQAHRLIFAESWPDIAGRFRDGEVAISGMSHTPPHQLQIQPLLHQHLGSISQRLDALGPLTPANLLESIRLSAETHYLVAHVHPFQDGNGRLARAMGDFVMLRRGMYYDVIMTDYRDAYLCALEDCELSDTALLYQFLLYSYQETLCRVSTFFNLPGGDR